MQFRTFIAVKTSRSLNPFTLVLSAADSRAFRERAPARKRVRERKRLRARARLRRCSVEMTPKEPVRPNVNGHLLPIRLNRSRKPFTFTRTDLP